MQKGSIDQEDKTTLNICVLKTENGHAYQDISQI
jgi:hypothetical protein